MKLSQLCLVLALGLGAAPAFAQPIDTQPDQPQPEPAPLADPQFRGPEIYDGAWQNEKAWSDAAAPDGSLGSYAYHYRVWALERADQHAEARTKLDCADLSIHMLCEYAALNKLPLSWRVYYPAERRFVTFSNTNRQFSSPEEFQRWSMHFLGAMNLADNTYAISYDEWTGGDMVLMDWNQSDESPNFEGRTVWHTYLIGKPDEVLYYGNISNGNPLPVTRVTGGSRMDMVRNHPDRHGYSPRRYRVLRGNEWGPVSERAEVIRVNHWVNVRAEPNSQSDKVGQANKGSVVPVLGRQGVWVKVLDAQGNMAWIHGLFLKTLPQPEVEPEVVEVEAEVEAEAEVVAGAIDRLRPLE